MKTSTDGIDRSQNTTQHIENNYNHWYSVSFPVKTKFIIPINIKEESRKQLFRRINNENL